ncbi:MAG TPA: hypothetical protein VGQ83_16460 [Polyangia bacterium]|jgi:hypothetical protein
MRPLLLMVPLLALPACRAAAPHHPNLRESRDASVAADAAASRATHPSSETALRPGPAPGVDAGAVPDAAAAAPRLTPGAASAAATAVGVAPALIREVTSTALDELTGPACAGVRSPKRTLEVVTHVAPAGPEATLVVRGPATMPKSGGRRVAGTVRLGPARAAHVLALVDLQGPPATLTSYDAGPAPACLNVAATPRHAAAILAVDTGATGTGRDLVLVSLAAPRPRVLWRVPQRGVESSGSSFHAGALDLQPGRAPLADLSWIVVGSPARGGSLPPTPSLEIFRFDGRAYQRHRGPR